jgi:hypothetical protein
MPAALDHAEASVAAVRFVEVSGVPGRRVDGSDIAALYRQTVVASGPVPPGPALHHQVLAVGDN